MFQIYTIILTPFQQNTRIIACEKTKEAVVVDPGGESQKVLLTLVANELKLKSIWLTHSHLDHCGGVIGVRREFDATLIGHPDERIMREKVEEIGAMYGLPAGLMENCPEPETYIRGGEVLSVGEYKFEVIFTPGHSPGHVCFYNKESGTLIAGDTLFQGSIGRTDIPGGNHALLIKSIKEKILTLPDGTNVMSGHGPDTTVGVERRTNPFLS